jgi:phosphatidylserine/phosphatidylglycerophosphate/cardiolipin synthase-like enzyme
VWPSFDIVLRDESQILPATLGTSRSDDNTGRFSLNYDPDILATTYGPRILVLRIYASAYRLVLEQKIPDTASATLDFGDLMITQSDASGWVVSLAGATTLFPVRAGNAIRFLIDDQEAWGHVSDKMVNSMSSIEVMQLEFDIPHDFNSDPNLEPPDIVLQFDAPLDAADLRIVHRPKDYRPERVLLDRSAHGVKVRILINDPKVDSSAIGTVSLLPFIAIVLFILSPQVRRGAWKFICGLFSTSSAASGSVSDVKGYFGSAGNLEVQPFPVSEFNRVHAKLVLVDAMEAIVVSSPFIQGYYDTNAHIIDEPKRGRGVDVPIHDVSIAIRGPAVADMHESFRLHWNLQKPVADQLPAIPPAGPITVPNTGESISSLQLVRTLSAQVFPGMTDGEKGVLEAYLRAIGNAQNFIYLENQYFTNDTIGNALIAALHDPKRPKLQIIMLLNVIPDIPMYPSWQVSLISRIRKEATPTNVDRIGFFTVWSHEKAAAPAHPLPRIIPNYVHTKVGIVDGKWATVGSANLDGSSLDYTQLLNAFHPGEIRNHEINYVLYNGIAGAETTDNAVDLLRRRLWGEHLGLADTDSKLAAGVSGTDDWLKLWRNLAEAKLAGLQNDPGTPVGARILEYPAKPTADPEEFLKRSSIAFAGIELVDAIRPFSFHKGAWE